MLRRFRVTGWNGDVVRGAFVLDAHDREIIAWRCRQRRGQRLRHPRHDARSRGDLLRALRARHPVEWLSDHGSIYTARETRVFASQPNLVPCFTPVASPGSNGMSEAFVKTLKRD